ncbi:MAG TPA: hypothetical protein VIK41_22395 [Gemmatimonadaceae bacterium]
MMRADRLVRRMRWTLSIALLVTARAASGQASEGLDSATAAAIAPIVQQARAANLPVTLLYAKAREGQVQRVPVAKIEAVVRTLADRMRTANEALKPGASEQELHAAADAIKSGVGPETLRAMREAGGDGSLAVPIGVLTQLIARGVPVERASMEVVALLKKGAVAKNFIALEESVRQDVLAGRRPDESLDLRLKGIIPNLPQSANADAAGLNAGSPRRPR